MLDSPIPKNEAERLLAVKDLVILDTPTETRFDRITALATKLFNVPISTLTIMDSDREWFKSCQGVETRESPRVISFCGHVIASKEEIMVIEDTLADSRFSDNPMVVGPPYIRFYAGVPIFSLSGERVGVFCIKDTKPRSLNEIESFMLETLASWAELEVNITSMKKLLDTGGNEEKLRPLLERLTHRSVIENLKSIKFGLKAKLGEESDAVTAESEEAKKYIEDLIFKIQKAVES